MRLLSSRPPRSAPSGAGGRRALVVLLTAVVVLALVEALVRVGGDRLPDPVAWGNPYTDAKFGQLRTVDEADVEVLLTGSSIVNAGISPRLLQEQAGTRAYNAGLPGAAAPALRLWLRDVALPLTCPSQVVVGVSIRDFNDHDTAREHSVRRLLDSEGYQRWTGEARLLSRLEGWAASHSEFVYRRAALREPGKVLQWLNGEEVEGWPARTLTPGGRHVGFDDRDYGHSERRLENQRTGVFRQFVAGSRAQADLAELVETADATGARVAVVRLPGMHERMVELDLVPAAEVDAFDRGVQAVAEGAGADFLDLGDLDDRPELFADEYHFNERGMTEVSGRVAALLAATEPPATSPTC